jgi:class 3 adenylate cyclase
VVFQEGDYFGRTVNIAARIADYARPGKVLGSQEVVMSGGNRNFDWLSAHTVAGG